MPDFYERMQGTATRLLHKFKTGVCTLIRTTPGAPVDGEPWNTAAPTETTYTLDAAVTRVSEEFIDGTTIVATDEQIVFAVPAVTPTMSDKFTVDGVERVLKDLRPKPAAGTPVAFIAIIAA